MNPRLERRTEIGLSQAAAASEAGVSLATWRRWEEEPAVVSERTRRACEAVIDARSTMDRALQKSAEEFENAWGESQRLTPRQAYALALTLDGWADGELESWVRDPDVPLFEISPFNQFDRRVLFYIEGSRSWVQEMRERCYAISDELERGVLPFDRDGIFIDELLIGAAMSEAEDLLNDMPEVFDQISAREVEEENSNEALNDATEVLLTDDDWDVVSDGFDAICRWDEWEVPRYIGHPLLPLFLAQRHPLTWFDQMTPLE